MTVSNKTGMPVPLLLLILSLLPVLMASTGFLFGITVGRWQGVLSLLAVCTLSLLGKSPTRLKIRTLAWFLLSLFGIICVSGLSVMYTNADAEAYHRPASFLLAQGWNPVFDSTPETLAPHVGEKAAINLWHIAYLPRGAWVLGAILYSIFGFVEVADGLNVLAFFVSLFYVFPFVSRLFRLTKWPARFITGVVAFSPVVANGMFGGSFDSAFFSFFMIALCCATLYLEEGRSTDLVALCISLAMMAGIKFTGVTTTVLSVAIFSVPLVGQWIGHHMDGQGTRWSGSPLSCVADRVVAVFQRSSLQVRTACSDAEKAESSRKLRNWFVMAGCCFCLIGVIGFSPYVTSWVRHGGPFYPAQTFDKRVTLEDKISCDFGYMNDDARSMGYFGRFGYAYVSQWLTYAYYRQKQNKPSFAPDFKVSGGVGGFGPVFRFAFMVALLLLPFARKGSLKWGLLLLMATVLIQPTYYSGYARYVPQFYVFPVLVITYVAVGIRERWNGWVSNGLLYAQAGYALALLAYPLSFMALQWIISVQNLRLLETMQKDPRPQLQCNTYYSLYSLKNDYGLNPVFVKDAAAVTTECREYSPYFSTYRYYAKAPVEGFPVLNHEVSGNDPAIIRNRNSRNMRFFLVEFLPEQVVGLPRYFYDVGRLRIRCFFRNWLGSGK